MKKNEQKAAKLTAGFSPTRALAESIAEALFVDGEGNRAGRLVMETNEKFMGSGWCKEAVADVIERRMLVPGSYKVMLDSVDYCEEAAVVVDLPYPPFPGLRLRVPWCGWDYLPVHEVQWDDQGQITIVYFNPEDEEQHYKAAKRGRKG